MTISQRIFCKICKIETSHYVYEDYSFCCECDNKIPTTKEKMSRLDYFEGNNVKFALGNNDESLLATLIYSSDFENEMEIRVTNWTKKFSVRGYKSIMDKWTFEKFQNKVEYHLENWEALKN